ncbi:hypothetical protein [Actinoplanes subtropicus]|uniref:hypothetical protein n=1 Tax=Actinoplanes subtropicus TaxID=543632 RepID=UPI0004C3642F|nr:hypothetical protein [Actinoplanes subtropicus]
MKFFSNDAKENSDEPYGRDHSDVVTSDPVTVPQQRAGSPWSTEPTTTEPASTETDGPRHADPASGTDTSAPDTASTGTDTEAGSPDDQLADEARRDGTDEEPASRRDEHDLPDEPATVTTYHPDGTVETEDRADSPVRDEGTFDSPQAVEPATGEPLATGTDDSDESDKSDESEPAARRDVTDEPVEEQAVKDEGTFDSPQAVEPATGEPLATGTDDSGTSDGSDGSDPAARRGVAEAPVAAAAPSAPGSVDAPPLDRLFTDGDSFADRFRDIQLRFVDSPKEATADAAALVGEAVDKVTEALRAQKDALGGDSEDTEQLRVQLRSYRDLLNRLSAL